MKHAYVSQSSAKQSSELTSISGCRFKSSLKVWWNEVGKSSGVARTKVVARSCKGMAKRGRYRLTLVGLYVVCGRSETRNEGTEGASEEC